MLKHKIARKRGLKLIQQIQRGELTRIQVLNHPIDVLKHAYNYAVKFNLGVYNDVH